MTEIAYRLHMPEVQRTSVVFASPHSGRRYTSSFLERAALDAHTLRSSEDAYVDELFSAAPGAGAPLLAAVAPRAWVDLNRGADELDPAVIHDVRRVTHNPRVSSGLGVIPRVVSNGRGIYDGKISLTEARERLESVWHPYHAKLQALMDTATLRFGEAILIDCHSMPHEAVATHSPRNRPTPEIVLGDRYGASCDKRVSDRIEAAFRAEGLRVARNTPFAGAYVTQQYGRPSRSQHVVQVEIDRALYMNEKTIEPSADFEAVKAMVGRIVARIADIGADEVPMAAE